MLVAALAIMISGTAITVTDVTIGWSEMNGTISEQSPGRYLVVGLITA